MQLIFKEEMNKKITKNKKLSFFEDFNKWKIFIFLAVFAIYGNSIFNNYSLDDEFVIKNNVQVQQGIKAIPEIFTTQYFIDKVSSFGYRPVTKAVFAIEYQIFGENPRISHLINVLLFALTSILLLKLLVKIILPKTGAVFVFIVMLIWVFHPIHTEVVASLKNREELLYLIFCLLSLQNFMSFIEKQKWYYFIFAILLYVLGYLTKQSAISFALIIPMVLWFMYIKFENVKQFIKENFRIIISVVVLLVVTFILYKLPTWFFPTDKIELLTFENPLRIHQTKIVRLSLSMYAMLINAKLLFIPHPLVFYYGQYTIPEVHISDFLVIFSLIFHVSILYYVIKNLKKKSVLLFGTLFYFLGMLPFTNYFMVINGIVAERFLYAPSIGFAIVLTFFIFKISKTNINSNSLKSASSMFRYIVIIIIFAYSIKTIARNSSWKDSYTLYSNDIQYLNNSVKANDILAQTIMDRVMKDAALYKSLAQVKPSLDSVITYYSRSLELFPSNPKALNNIANIHINFYNKPDIAITYLQKAFILKPKSYEIAFNIAKCYEMLKNDNEAVKYYLITINNEPNHPDVWNNLIGAYYRMNLLDSARITCEKMITYDSITDVPYLGLGYYYISKKDTTNAIKNWEKAIEKNPQNYQRCLSLSKYYYLHKDTVKANYYYQKSLEAKMLSKN